MKNTPFHLCLFLCISVHLGIAVAQESEEDVFEYSTEFDPITGQGAQIGGFLFPELFLNTTGGVTQNGVDPSDLATSEHDPQNDFGVQSIEVHLDIDFDSLITGRVYGAGRQGAEEWEAALEEAILHYHVTDWLAVGGGQFLNRFGFQAEKHLHVWDFVNQNLINSRMLNEGELITQGGEIVMNLPTRSVVTIGGGGVRTHAHDHGHGEEDEHGHEEEYGHEDEHGHEDEDDHGHEEDDHDEGEEDHHLEADNANFSDWVLSVDWRQQLPFDETATLSTSLATGENGFGRQTWVYGAGLEKIWGAHDHGDGPEFCAGAFMARSEFIGRNVEIQDEDGEQFDGNDFGFSTALYFGLSESMTLSLRHDWVSDMPELELEDRHRISPAITTYLGGNERIQARLQYDYNHSTTLQNEHAAWLQIQIQWGGHGGGHHHH